MTRQSLLPSLHFLSIDLLPPPFYLPPFSPYHAFLPLSTFLPPHFSLLSTLPSTPSVITPPPHFCRLLSIPIHFILFISSPTPFVLRDGEDLDELLERQADMIRYLQQHNANLGRRILELQAQAME